MAPRQCAGRLGLIVCTAMLASCAQLAAVRNALFDADSDADADAGARQTARLPDPPEDTAKAGGETDYVTFVQEVMAESAKLTERPSRAAKATRAATAWRRAGGGGQDVEGGQDAESE